jgi:hypothetical protein
MPERPHNGHPLNASADSTEPRSVFERRKVPRDKFVLGVVALVSWLLLFSAGLLIETVEYRLVLSPRSVAKQIGVEGMKSVPSHSTTQEGGQAASAASDSGKPATFSPWYSFFASVFCFTPINLALLTLTAGLLGGCGSNIAIETMPDMQRDRLRETHPRRHLYLQEPPVSAAIRGFIVYLCVIAGLYVAMDDPFKDPTPAQYIRLAGTLSILALMVGYDSSRLEDWLAIIPGPGHAASHVPTPEPPVPAGNVEAMLIEERRFKGIQKSSTDAPGNEAIAIKHPADLPGPSSITFAAAADGPIPTTQQEAAAKEAAAAKILSGETA